MMLLTHDKQHHTTPRYATPHHTTQNNTLQSHSNPHLPFTDGEKDILGGQTTAGTGVNGGGEAGCIEASDTWLSGLCLYLCVRVSVRVCACARRRESALLYLQALEEDGTERREGWGGQGEHGWDLVDTIHPIVGPCSFPDPPPFSVFVGVCIQGVSAYHHLLGQTSLIGRFGT